MGFIIKKKYKNNITNFIGISERVALLQVKFECFCLTIIQAYSPTERSTEEEIEKFYKDIEFALTKTEGKVIVMGDFNAKIGCPKTNNYPVMGKHGYGVCNERGERLLSYAYQHKLSIMNTFFKKKESRRWTWLSPDQKTKNEIDYILTTHHKLITNVEIIHKFQFSSDHRLVRATLLLGSPVKSRKTFTTPPTIPKTETEIKEYIKNLRSHTENVETNSIDIQTYYNILERGMIESLTYSKNRAHPYQHNILTKDTIHLIERRTELQHKGNKTKDMKEELSRIYKETSRSIRKDYNNYRYEIISKNIKNFRSAKKAYKDLTTHKSWIHKLEHNSQETKSRQDVINQATNYYKNLYKQQNNNEIEAQTIHMKITDPISQIENSEVLEHIKKLKADKSPGPDGICNEALKIGAPVLTPHFTQLFNLILEEEKVPKQWCTSDIILLFKKGNSLDIGNYRPISLLASTYKLFSSIILKRISDDIDRQQPKEQAGFRSGFSTVDHIHTLEQIIEKYREYNRPLYVAFIDYSKAFDSISHCSIWNALLQSNIHCKYINILKYIYTNSTSRVKLETRGDDINLERGIRQGDPLSPKLFIVVLEYIFQQLDWKKKGVYINGQYLNHLRFADDIVIIAETAKDLEEMMRSLDDESSKTGLEMNVNKTKILTNHRQRPLVINGNNIEYVSEYIYLGKQTSFKTSSNQEEVTRRINATWKKYWALREILKGNYSLHMKRTIFNTCLLPCLLYGCQTWTYTNKIKQQIKCSQTAMERSMLKIRRIHKIRNENIRQKTKLTDALRHALSLKWKWAGHISRYSDRRWTIEATRWKGPVGKRNVGRQLKRWADDIIDVVGNDWMKTGKDRELWSRMEEAFTQKGVQI